jgi:hypothetical protein
VATVPQLQGPSVQLQAAPQVRLQNTVNADALNIRERQVGALGEATEQAGLTAMDVQQQLVARANALRVDDAFNQAQEAALRLQHGPQEGYTRLKGQDALKRDSGMPLPEEFTGLLDQRIAEISDGLTPAQRQMFARQANGLRTNFLGNAMVYTGQQAQVYGMSVREASTTNAANALVMNFSDPTNVAYQTNRIRANIEGAVDPDTGEFIPGSAQMQGKSAAWAKEKADEAVSGAHTAAIQAAMEGGNVNAAMTYRQKYGQQMTATDMLKVDGILQKNYDTMRGATAANTVFTSPPVQAALNPTDLDRLENVVLNIESGGRRFGTDGKILEGPQTRFGTAKGEMQVLDSTNLDPGYGVAPAKDNSPEERARVGKQYLQALVKHYDGDVAKATAAYNWGPGNVDKAVKDAQANAGKGEVVAPDAWLASAPTETRNYVASVQRKMGNPTLSNPTRPTLEQLQSQAVAALGANPSALAAKTAKDQVAATYEVQTKALKQRADETVQQAMQALEQNGGRYSELAPKLRSALVQHAPDKVDEVMNYGVRVAKGDDITDDRLYLRLSNNPQELKKLSDSEFYSLRKGLSQADFQHFSNIRGTLISGKAGDSAGDINEQAINRVFNQRLQSLGIPVNPDKRDTAAEMRVGAMRSFIDKRVMAAQQAAGKKLTDVETQRVIDETFAQNVAFRSSFFGLRGGGSQPLMTATVDTIPDDTKAKIKKAFADNGNSNPTDGQILGVYLEGASARRNVAQPTPAKPAPSPLGGGASGTF